jgi:site-specific DNA-methyltransferase (adenine-specific)
MKPYYQDDSATIYLGDMMEIAPSLAPVDAIVADPPYDETSLEWDVLQSGWPKAVFPLSNQLWCFGSARMFRQTVADFKGWEFSQEIIWVKHNGSNPTKDKFRRIHENISHFYRGNWGDLHVKAVKTADATKRTLRRKGRPNQWGNIGGSKYQSVDGGLRFQTSVIHCASCHGYAVHPTQKPEGIIRPLLEYSVPPAGSVLDPFMGSGTTLRVAKDMGLRAIGIEKSERFCELAARRLAQEVLPMHIAGGGGGGVRNDRGRDRRYSRGTLPALFFWRRHASKWNAHRRRAPAFVGVSPVYGAEAIHQVHAVNYSHQGHPAFGRGWKQRLGVVARVRQTPQDDAYADWFRVEWRRLSAVQEQIQGGGKLHGVLGGVNAQAVSPRVTPAECHLSLQLAGVIPLVPEAHCGLFEQPVGDGPGQWIRA